MKKKILSYIFAFCLILPCAFLLTGCKKIKSYAFYLNDKQIENSTLCYNYGDDVSSKLNDVTLVIKAKKETLKYTLKDIDYTLSYNDFSTTISLDDLPVEWNAGTYSFDCSVDTNYGKVETSLKVAVAQVSNNVSYEFSINDSNSECEWEFDRSPVLGNDPVMEFSVNQELVEPTYTAYYLSESQYNTYKNLSKAEEKTNYLQSNGKLYSGSYNIAPNTYYMYAIIDNGQNYLDYYTNLVKCTVTRAYQDYSMINLKMDYTFNIDTLNGTYVTLSQIVNEIGMPSIMDFDGVVIWNEDYSDLQISYSADNPTLTLKAKIVPNTQYVDYSHTEFDVALTLHQDLIAIPTKIEYFSTFAYNEEPQGITTANAPEFFENWLSANALKFVTGNFETHINANDYTLTLTLNGNPNIAFTEDGTTASSLTSVSYDWKIDKALQRFYLEGLTEQKIRIDEDDVVEVIVELPADNKIALPTVTPFEVGFFLNTTITYEILENSGDYTTTGTATIENGSLVVTKDGTVIVKITKPGNDNVKTTTATIIYTITQ